MCLNFINMILVSKYNTKKKCKSFLRILQNSSKQQKNFTLSKFVCATIWRVTFIPYSIYAVIIDFRFHLYSLLFTFIRMHKNVQYTCETWPWYYGMHAIIIIFSFLLLFVCVTDCAINKNIIYCIKQWMGYYYFCVIFGMKTDEKKGRERKHLRMLFCRFRAFCHLIYLKINTF